MACEYCPRCRTARDTRVELTPPRAVTAPDGTVRQARTRTVHCARCHQFIRSEEVDQPRADAA